ncbi:site-specific integrase [Paenibacillus glycinis]|uniref:Tyrosine-type recombinase/integrase n=1 Tax=Paenibacillus glycinis TaxID=2697035 RepID=A0ABW9XXN7_9BACL|nr:site-specific integrase [Paenibacillus glycinis]NBD27011.1 tyrosine-type recombinase/integrase [Paenibacillus glycinis]
MASIEKRSKNSYRLIVEAGYDSAGKRIKRSKTIKASGIREAEKKLAMFQVEVEAGEYIAPEKMTFSTFVQEWNQKYGIKHLELKTLESYSHMLKNHILPSFANKRLDEINPMHIVSLLKTLEQEGARKDGKSGGLSSTTIRFIHRILKDIFDRAVEWRIIKINPVEAIKRPKISKTNVDVYNESEVSTLLQAIINEPIQWRLMITLALTTGLRRGELLALEWKHLNLHEGVIDVKQSLTYVKGKHIIKPPKTKSSIRKVSIPEALIQDLMQFHAKAHHERIQLDDLWEGGEHFFIFSSWHGKPYYHTVPGTWLRRFLKRKKLKPIRFHDLRHTSATLLINQGVHAKTIAGRLGHADIRTTMNIYGHSLLSADHLAANTFNAILSPKKENPLKANDA